MTHRLSKPASSAAAAISRRRRAISAGPPGHVKRGSCRPKRIVVRSPSAPRSAASAAGTTVTGPGGWTAAKPSVGEGVAHGGPALQLRAHDRRRDGRAPRPVPRPDLGRRDVEGDGEAGDAGRLGQRAVAGALRRVERERVDDGGDAPAQALLHDGVEQGEGVLRRADVVLAVADQRPQRVARHDLVGGEPLGGPRGLPRRGGSHQHDQAGRRQGQGRRRRGRWGHRADVRPGGPSAVRWPHGWRCG